MVDINKVLSSYGLGRNEIKVYLAVLKSGSCSVTQIRKRLRIPKTTTRDNLGFLMKKGLVHQTVHKNGLMKLYQAENPQKLLVPLTTKLAQIQAIIPKLKAMQKSRK